MCNFSSSPNVRVCLYACMKVDPETKFTFYPHNTHSADNITIIKKRHKALEWKKCRKGGEIFWNVSHAKFIRTRKMIKDWKTFSLLSDIRSDTPLTPTLSPTLRWKSHDRNGNQISHKPLHKGMRFHGIHWGNDFIGLKIFCKTSNNFLQFNHKGMKFEYYSGGKPQTHKLILMLHILIFTTTYERMTGLN